MTQQPTAITLLSGGLDSVVATALARTASRIVLAITCDYGQRAAPREVAAAARFCAHWNIPHRVIALPWLADITQTALVQRSRAMPRYTVVGLSDMAVQTASARAVWVPNRNGIFLNVAAGFADAMNADCIIAGFNREEAATFPDNTPEFMTAATHALSYSTANHARVESPTALLDKIEIAQHARRLHIPLDWCWPCYEGGESLCGTCESCVRFQRAIGK